MAGDGSALWRRRRLLGICRGRCCLTPLPLQLVEGQTDLRGFNVCHAAKDTHTYTQNEETLLVGLALLGLFLRDGHAMLRTPFSRTGLHQALHSADASAIDNDSMQVLACNSSARPLVTSQDTLQAGIVIEHAGCASRLIYN